MDTTAGHSFSGILVSWVREMVLRRIFHHKDPESSVAQANIHMIEKELTQGIHDVIRDACKREIQSGFDRNFPKLLDGFDVTMNEAMEKLHSNTNTVSILPQCKMIRLLTLAREIGIDRSF